MKKIITILGLLSLIFAIGEIGAADTATLSFSPSQKTLEQGQSFTVTILVNTGSTAANAAGITVSFPEDKLEATSISTAGSALTIFAEKEIGEGQIKISGGTPTPGFSGQKTVASIAFRAKVSSGSAQVKFIQESVVLKDSDNTNFLDLNLSGSLSVTLKAPAGGTAPVQDTQAPVISNIRTVNVTRDSATLAWQTDENSDSQIEYGLEAGQYSLTWSDISLIKEHTAVLGALPPGETFYFIVIAKDAAGNQSKSAEQLFSLSGYAIEITYLKENGQPLVGVEAILSDITGGTVSGFTNETGKVVFENVMPGKATVQAEYQDSSLSQEIEILASPDLQAFSFEFPAKELGLGSGIYVGLGISILLFLILLIILIKLIKGFKRKPFNAV